MASFQQILHAAKGQLEAAGIETPMVDACLLMTHVSGLTRSDFIVCADDPISKPVKTKFWQALMRREAGEPIAYIIGKKEFWSLDFAVTKNVLIPRPETEGVVSAALDLMKERKDYKVLDVGTGAGAILISILHTHKTARGYGIDISQKALSIAQKNATTLGVLERCKFDRSDFLKNVVGQFDIIVSNPPYIDRAAMQVLPEGVKDYEPDLALSGGEDGLNAYRKIIDNLPRRLKPGGHVIFEIGYDQKIPVEALLAKAGFSDLSCQSDLAGLDRIVSAKYI
ncbi:MAG: peptide chain release factor N(5)-glutamine methyltransferase [Robiginitomaculum sp.]